MVNFHISQQVGEDIAALLSLTDEVSCCLLHVFSRNFKSCETFHILTSHILNLGQRCSSGFFHLRSVLKLHY